MSQFVKVKVNQSTLDFYRIRLCPLKVYFLKYWVVWSSRSIIVIWSYSPYSRMSVLLIRCWEVRPLVLVHWWNNFCSWKLTLCRTIISGCPVRPSVFPLLVHSLFSWVKLVGHFINFNFMSIFMWHFHVYLCSSYYRSPSTRVVVCLKLSQLICLQVYDLLSACAPIEYSAVVLVETAQGQGWGSCSFASFPGIRSQSVHIWILPSPLKWFCFHLFLSGLKSCTNLLRLRIL